MRRPASLARRAIDRRRTRRQRNDDFLMHIAFIVILLEEEEAAAVMASRGSKAGKKNLPRVRKSIDAMLTELGNYVRRAYRMTLEAFLELHDALAPALLSTFRTGSTDTAPTGPTGGFLCTKLRLSAAIRFFAGTEVWDLMVLADYQDIGPSVGNPSQASERPYRPSLCAGYLPLPPS